MTKDEWKEQNQEKGGGGGWFAGEINSTLSLGAIFLLRAQMACSAVGVDTLPRGIRANLAAPAHINGCNFKPDRTVLTIVLLERLIMISRISSSSKTGHVVPNFKLATQIKFFPQLWRGFIISLLISWSQTQPRISFSHKASIESNNHNLKWFFFFYPRKR